jgi:voltage-gated potassium channel
VSPHASQKNVRKIAFQILIGIGIFSTIVAISTFAYFLEGWSLGDAFYMVIITIFGVGYEEVRPVDTPIKRLITILTIIAGPIATVYVIGSMVKIITEKEFRKAISDLRKSKNMEDTKNHTIICGFGRIGQTIARELKKTGLPFLIIDREAARISLSENLGYLTLDGDAGEEETLVRAHIGNARSLVAVLPNDMANVFITLTARNLNPSIRIISRAENPSTEKKLRQAGANEIILPALAGGLQIAHRIIRPSLLGVLENDTTFLRNDLLEIGVELDEKPIDASMGLVGKPLSLFIENTKGTSIVLAVRRADGTNSLHPSPHLVIQDGDRIIYLSRKNG